MPPETCPNCGADVPRKAKACPECGACEKTGWSDEHQSGDLGLPEEEFNYEEFVKREFGARKALPYGISWYWWVVSLLLVGVLIWLILR
jgi:hypothetical protein